MPPLGDIIGDRIPDLIGDGAAGAVTIASILGDRGVFEYDAAVYTPGATSPDVEAAPNILDPGPFDLIQTTEAQRPHAVTDASGHPAWAFSAAGLQTLVRAPGSNVAAIGDVPRVWVAGRFSPGPANQCLLSVEVGTTVNSAFLFFRESGLLHARIVAQTYGQMQASRDITGDGDLHIFHAYGDGPDWHCRVDEGTPGTTTQATDIVLNAAPTSITLGALVNGAYYHDSNILHVVMAKNVSSEQDAAVTAYLRARYGL